MSQPAEMDLVLANFTALRYWTWMLCKYYYNLFFFLLIYTPLLSNIHLRLELINTPPIASHAFLLKMRGTVIQYNHQILNSPSENRFFEPYAKRMVILGNDKGKSMYDFCLVKWMIDP